MTSTEVRILSWFIMKTCLFSRRCDFPSSFAYAEPSASYSSIVRWGSVREVPAVFAEGEAELSIRGGRMREGGARAAQFGPLQEVRISQLHRTGSVAVTRRREGRIGREAEKPVQDGGYQLSVSWCRDFRSESVAEGAGKPDGVSTRDGPVLVCLLPAVSAASVSGRWVQGLCVSSPAVRGWTWTGLQASDAHSS